MDDSPAISKTHLGRLGTFLVRIVLCVILLLAIAVTAVFFRDQREKSIAKSIEAQGGSIVLRSGLPDWTPQSIRRRTPFVESAYSVDINGFEVPTKEGTTVSAEFLSQLGSLTHLKQLDLSQSSVNDKDMSHLVRLSELEYLRLGDTSVTDTGLEHLATLSNLKSLDLCRTGVNGDGLKYLAGLNKLAELNLAQSDVTDTGLRNTFVGAYTSHRRRAEVA
jgi:hypothetical protein